jgi:uncharacterized protein (DUF1501 family)
MKYITRREFIKGTTAFGALACCSAGLGIGRPQLAFGQLPSAGSCAGNTVVMFNLFGGACHLNSFAIPRERGAYYDIRPTIGIPGTESLPTGDGFAFHPALQTLHSLYLDGDVTIFPNIAEPVGSRSHFTAQQFMSLADGRLNTQNTGWVGGISEQLCNRKNGADGTYNFKFGTMGFGVGQQRDFQTSAESNEAGCARPAVIPRLAGYSLERDGSNTSATGLDSMLQEEIAERMLSQSSLEKKSQLQRLANQSIESVYEDVGVLQNIASEFAPSVTYANNRTGNYFRDVSSMIRSCIGVKLTYGGLGGWDNHSNMGGITGTQANLLTQFNAGLTAFSNEMKQAGMWDKVTIVVFTEFGRTNRENSSLGTDHGWAGAIILIGGSVNKRIYGHLPTDTELRSTRNRINPTADYREAYFPALEWAGIDPYDVFKNYSPANKYNIFKV